MDAQLENSYGCTNSPELPVRGDEPQGLALIGKSRTAIAIHGENNGAPIVFLGRLETEMLARFRASFKESGFHVETHSSPELQGTSRENICNRALSGCGMQLELSKGLRETVFASLTRDGRRTRKPEFYKFVEAIGKAI